MAKPDVRGFYDEPSGSIGYVVSDPDTGRAVIIDPMLDYDEKAARISTATADLMLAYVTDRNFKVDWIFDTHPHADHLSAAAYLKEKIGAPTAIGEKIVEVQKIWRDIYNELDFPCDGAQWDKLFADGATFSIGNLPTRVMLTAGHTKASITYVIGDAAFVNDTLFQPDTGSARCDFPGGNAETQYDSIMSILALPPETRLFTGHDYRQGGRPAQWQSTVAEQRAASIHFKNRPSRDDYVRLRLARDKTLPLPRLILHALQFNLRGGRLPPPESNGRSYLRIPVNYF
ncbi:MAG: MBL fold metallo-hydrolase [Pseudolabrys sp.]|nr:MBL fold metallo-hydrolase [Pseudolabrys sp.]